MWQWTVWQRIAVIVSVAWLGGVLIYSATSKNFAWFGYRGDLGPATITASVGIIVIVIVCLGIPWIAEAAGKSTGLPRARWFPKLRYQVTLATAQGRRSIPFDEVVRFDRHRRDGDLTVATFYLTTGEAVTGEAMEGVLQLLSKTLVDSDPKPHKEGRQA